MFCIESSKFHGMSQHYSDTIMHQSRTPTSDISDTEVTSEAIDISRTIFLCCTMRVGDIDKLWKYPAKSCYLLGYHLCVAKLSYYYCKLIFIEI